MDKKLFIFDLDGTLVNAYSAIYKSLNYTLKELGYKPVSYNKAKASVGTGDRNFILTFFKEKDVLKAFKIYRARHKKDLLSSAKTIPYAKLLLRRLKSLGKYVAIASNRPREFSDIIIKKTKIKKYIDYVLCGDEIKSLKPSPKILNEIIKRFKVKKESAVFIGDMDIDLETAKRAKVSAVFVCGGSSPQGAVKKYKDKKMVSSLKQLIGIV